MKILKSITHAGKQFNEDYLQYINYSYVLVLDGSTGLGENKIARNAQDRWNTDAQWFVQKFGELVERYMDNTLPIKELVRKCIEELSANYWELVSKDTSLISQPSASMILMKKTDDKVELLSIGDLTAFIQQKDGSVIEIKDDRICMLDNQVIDLMEKESQTLNIDVIEALQLSQVQSALRRNRKSKNQTGGYYVLGLEPDVLKHALYKELTVDDWTRILICSDGFYASKDYGFISKNTSEQFMNYIASHSLKKVLKQIRRWEEADPGCNKHPRFKISDDATAVLVVNDAEDNQSGMDHYLLEANMRWHKLKGKLQSIWMTFGIKKSYLITRVIAFIILIMTVVAVAYLIYEISQNKAVNLDLFSIANFYWVPPLVGLLVSSLDFIYKAVEYKALESNYLIFSDYRKKHENLTKIGLRKEQKEAGYQISAFFNGSENEYFMMSSKVNDYLLENTPIDIVNLKRNFTLVNEVKKYVPAIMKPAFKGKRIFYNSKLLRQATELYPGISRVNVQKSTYFDGQCTQEIVYKQFKSVDEIKMGFDGINLLVDEENLCYPLDYSSCANFLGASTIVFTRDHKIILGRQGNASKSNPGRYAPSGSGSIDFADIRKTKKRNGYNRDVTLQEVLVTAMEREFCEECNYPVKKGKEKLSTQVIGYARLLERGGKPDYFGVSYMDEDSKNIKRNVMLKEYGIAKQFIILYYHKESDIPKVLRKFCNEYLVKRQISIQIELITQILEHIEETLGIEAFMDKLRSLR